jgi:RNA polymerase sigma factor (sigma-70 family)
MTSSLLERDIERSRSSESSTLIRLALSGCRTAWGILIEAQRGALLRAARFLLASRLLRKESVSDLVGRAIGIAYQKRATFRGSSRSELSAWLRGILKKTALRVGRYFGQPKRDVGREIALANCDPTGSQRSVAAPMEKAELQDLVRAALAKLPAQSQEVIQLRITEGMTFPEIGRRLNKDSAAARMQFERALKTLRGTLHDVGSQSA